MSDEGLLINISKISPPSLPSILNRPRLLDLLEKNKDKKIILILGQAAQGKTTLAASYVKISKIPSAWINLDKEDSDPVKLLGLIVGSLQHVFKDIDFSRVPPYSYRTMDSRPEIFFFREWVGYIFKTISMPIQIVIDGLDRLSPDTPAFKLLRVFVEDAPPNIHLILLSRGSPPFLELHQHKIRQEALILTNEELAFTRNEIAKFFKETRKTSFNADQLKRIHLSTEGWIGGLVLLSEYMNQFPDLLKEKDIYEDLPDHFKGEIFSYFGLEIFSSQSKHVQEFLIRSSVIDLIELDFMKNFVEIENAEEILWGLAEKNLFVQSYYDEKKGWLFRYHQLFRGFLRAKFKSEVGDEGRRLYLIKAGCLYEQRGELENSVKYFLEAKAYPQAVLVIERLGMALLRGGRRDDVAQWLRRVPEKIVKDNPWLLLYQAMTRRFQAGKENIAAIEKAYTLFKQKGDTKGILLSLAHLIEVAIPLGIQLTPLEQLIKEAETIIESPDSDRYQEEKAVLWYCIGNGHISGGDIRKGIWASQNASLIAKKLGDIWLQASAMTISMLGFIHVGEFALSDEASQEIEKVIGESVYPEHRAQQLLFQCILATYQGDFAKADALAGRLQTEIEKNGFLFLYPWVYMVLGGLMLGRGEFKEAEEMVSRLLNAAISFQNAHLKGLAFNLLGSIYLNQGYLKKAKRAIDRSINIFSREYPSKRLINMNRVLKSLINCHLKDYLRAEEAIEKALNYFNEVMSYQNIVDAHFVIAFIKRDQGENDEAALQLEAGFKIAENKGYEYSPMLGPKYLIKACLLALELDVVKVTDYATRLLSTRLSSTAEVELKKLSNHRDFKMRGKVFEIIRRIHRSRVPCIYVQTLGRFQLFRGQLPVEEKEWDRRQPKQLLKAIIAHGGQNVPKDLLIEELWPDERPKASETAFDITLHRLRRTLEPKMERDFGSSYIHLNDGVIFLDPELCKLDINEFLSLSKEGERKEKKENIKDALSFYVKATEQYQGDFLLEDLYCQWIEMKREELRVKYVALLYKIGELYERQGGLRKAISFYKSSIQKDPLLEEAYQRLMVLYSQQKKRNEAIRAYEECKKALWDGLNTELDEVTIALYNRILETPSSFLDPTTTNT
jgi:LuxR family maltose regulon positive regulatory protein